MISWEIEARELITCSCSYGCPCQFSALPDNNRCEAIGGFIIDKGHHGDVRLDGTRFAFVLAWPGPIHQGKGRCQPVVDSGANAQQRDAILRILSGQDTEPFATVFAVFATTFEKVFDPIFTRIDAQIDVDARRGKIRAEGVLEIDGQPIRNPVSGQEHRARIDLPNGFEYELAEIGSGTSHSTGNIALKLENSYAQFARIHLGTQGVVRHRAAA